MPRAAGGDGDGAGAAGLALNRAGRGEEAERVLLDLIDERGPSSETYGLLGRVYKDRWDAAPKAGETFRARGLLDQAIEAYLQGFETDWRDAYPGINAVTLMELTRAAGPAPRGAHPGRALRGRAAHRSGKPDYWDHATLVELAVLARDEAGASGARQRARDRARAMGARDHRSQPAADPRGARAPRRAGELGSGD